MSVFKKKNVVDDGPEEHMAFLELCDKYIKLKRSLQGKEVKFKYECESFLVVMTFWIEEFVSLDASLKEENMLDGVDYHVAFHKISVKSNLAGENIKGFGARLIRLLNSCGYDSVDLELREVLPAVIAQNPAYKEKLYGMIEVWNQFSAYIKKMDKEGFEPNWEEVDA